MEKTTAFPSPIMLAATWDPMAAHEHARMIGEDPFLVSGMVEGLPDIDQMVLRILETCIRAGCHEDTPRTPAAESMF